MLGTDKINVHVADRADQCVGVWVYPGSLTGESNIISDVLRLAYPFEPGGDQLDGCLGTSEGKGMNNIKNLSSQ